MTNPFWPPSAQHRAYHEAGHAVLLDAYGVGIRYIAIEPDTDQDLASFAAPDRETSAQNYGTALVLGTNPVPIKPEMYELADYLAILVGGEAAAHLWSTIPDDALSVVAGWQPVTHQEDNMRDPQHRETRQACLVAEHFFDGDTERARAYVTAQSIRASKDLQERWRAVEVVAEALLGDYWKARARERSAAPVQGVLFGEGATGLIRSALKRSDQKDKDCILPP